MSRYSRYNSHFNSSKNYDYDQRYIPSTKRQYRSGSSSSRKYSDQDEKYFGNSQYKSSDNRSQQQRQSEYGKKKFEPPGKQVVEAHNLKNKIVQTQKEIESKREQEERLMKAKQLSELEEQKRRIIEQRRKIKNQQLQKQQKLKREAEQGISKDKKANVILFENESDSEDSVNKKNKSLSNELKNDNSSDQKFLAAQQIALKLEQKRQNSFRTITNEMGEEVPLPPSDPFILRTIDNLVEFVLKNGVEFEEVVRSKNKNSKQFKFLFDMLSPEYLYYKQKLRKAQIQVEELETMRMVKLARGDINIPLNQQPSLTLQQAPPNYQYPHQSFAPNTSNNSNKSVTQRASKWDIDSKNFANLNNDDLKFDRLDEQEAERARLGKRQQEYFDQASQESYRNVPPPSLSQTNSEASLATNEPRPHYFPVIRSLSSQNVLQSQQLKESLSANNNSGDSGFCTSENGGNDRSNRRRRFSEMPSGDVSLRSQSDSLQQMNQYVNRADQSSQREIIPEVEEYRSEDHINEAQTHHISHFLPTDQAYKFDSAIMSASNSQSTNLSTQQFSENLQNYQTSQPRNNKREFTKSAPVKRIGSDNIGHQMLQRMGQTQGSQLGPRPQNFHNTNDNIQTQNNERPSQQSDISNIGAYQAYKEKMKMSYRFRPNPMNNPRTPYY